MNTDRLISAAERVSELLALRTLPQPVKLALVDVRAALVHVIGNPHALDALTLLDLAWDGLAASRDTLAGNAKTAAAGHAVLSPLWLVQDVLREEEAKQRQAA